MFLSMVKYFCMLWSYVCFILSMACPYFGGSRLHCVCFGMYTVTFGAYYYAFCIQQNTHRILRSIEERVSDG